MYYPYRVYNNAKDFMEGMEIELPFMQDYGYRIQMIPDYIMVDGEEKKTMCYSGAQAILASASSLLIATMLLYWMQLTDVFWNVPFVKRIEISKKIKEKLQFIFH